MLRGFYLDFKSILMIIFCFLLLYYLSYVFSAFFIWFCLFVLLFFCLFNIALLERLPFRLPSSGRRRLSGAFLRKMLKKHSLRIQEFHFSKIALNPDLTLPEYRSRREHSGSVLKIENGALGVELRPFYWKKRISAPM